MVEQVAECARLVHLAVTQEVLASVLTVLDGEEHGLHHILHVDEGDVLRLVAHAEVGVLLDAVGHEEIVALARSVDPCGAENDEGQTLHRVEETLCRQFALAVGSVGLRRVILAYRLVGPFLAYRTVDAQRTEVDETFEGHVQCEQGIHQVLRSFGVDAEEIVLVQAFGDACRMYHHVEAHLLELPAQQVGVAEVERDEVDAWVGEVFLRTALAHGRPHLVALAQCLLYDETADETAGSGDENLVHNQYKYGPDAIFRRNFLQSYE